MNNKNTFKTKPTVQYLKIKAEEADQRIDNYLIGRLKGVPKSHIYRILRKGEVRINKKRVVALYRLKQGDMLRLPPIFLKEQAKCVPPSTETMLRLKNRILYEDADLIVINKPSGMSVHAGSTVRMGVIETMRHLYPKCPHIELAHRLDSETSGCLVLAKKKSVLRELHQLLRDGKVIKLYWAFTKGMWKKSECKVEMPLQKSYKEGGGHMVSVHQEGKQALSVFEPIKEFTQASLMEVKLFTGRTHQIRVHAQHQKHPIAGDDRYGDLEFNKTTSQLGLKRMFLHARSIEFTLSKGLHIAVTAPLDKELTEFLQRYEENYP